MPTHVTGSGRIRFIDPLDHHPSRLLAHVAGELPMGPLAARLVADVAKAHPGLDITYLSHRVVRDALDLAEGDDLARRLV